MADSYRVAVIGSTGRGDYGHAVDEAWLAVDNTEVVAVADDHAEGLAAAKARLGVTVGYLDYREMLDAVRPDIAAIGTRWLDHHRDMALAAVEHGAHVYMEKPFCRTLAEADEIVAACERSHVKLALAHPTRYSPRLNAIRTLIAEGKIGRVLEYRGRGKEDRRGGGEDLWVLGTHVMDMIRALGGHPQWCYGQVSQDGQPVTRRDVVEGNEGIGPLAGDAVRAMYGMPDGSTAYFSSCRNAAGQPSRYGLQIYGSEGMIELLEGTLPSVKFLADPSWSPGRSGATWQNVTTAGVDQPEPIEDSTQTSRHYWAIRDLIRAIEEDRQPLSGMYEARGATEMIVAVFESHRAGGPVALPLENRENPLAMLS